LSGPVKLSSLRGWSGISTSGSLPLSNLKGRAYVKYEYPPYSIGNNWTRDLTETVLKIGTTTNLGKFKKTASDAYGSGEYVAYADDEFQTSGLASGAFDKVFSPVVGNFWATSKVFTSTSDISTPRNLYIKLPYPITLRQYYIQTRTDGFLIQAPSKWTLQGSQDGTTWTTIHDISNVTSWTLGEKKYFTMVDETTKYSHFRWTFFRNSSTANDYLSILEASLISPDWQSFGTVKDILGIGHYICNSNQSSLTPSAGPSSLLLSGIPFDFVYRFGNTTISSFTATDWFTSTKDTSSAWIVVNGDLTISNGVTVIPPARKLFTVIFVRGNLTLNGSISMTARGANHSGTGDSGGYTAPIDIIISASGIIVPAAGGALGVSENATGTHTGQDGTNGQTGGGGSGSIRLFTTPGTFGQGAAGTSFCGGSGGGGSHADSSSVTVAVANGGAGGAGAGRTSTTSFGAGGGAGNPGGALYSVNAGPASPGGTGAGGTLVVHVSGTISGTGTLTSNGSAGGFGGGAGGGGSGGGSITIISPDSSINSVNSGIGITAVANGGSGGGALNAGDEGNAGGNGSVRAIQL
jgi:hypothetical protein